MAKESGLGATISVDDSGGVARAISNDITNFTTNTTRGVQDVTGIDKSAMERLLLLSDGTFELTGVFNDASNMSHDVCKTFGSTRVNRTVTLTVSGQILAMEMIGTGYSLNRGADGSFTWSVSMSLADGTEPTWTT